MPRPAKGTHMALSVTMKALSDPTRRRILEMLGDGRMTAGDIAAQFDLTQATVSHHLSVLRRADLVCEERHGTSILYEINTSVFEDVLSWLSGVVGRKGDGDDEHGDE